MEKSERDFYLGKAHSIVETFTPETDEHRPYILEAIADATRPQPPLYIPHLDHNPSIAERRLWLAARRVVEDFKAGDRTFKQVEDAIEGLSRALEEILVA